MGRKNFSIDRPGKTALLSALALCTLLFLVVQCGLYAGQIKALTAEKEELSATLTEKEAAITAKTQEIEKLQAQLAEIPSMEEDQTADYIHKKGGVYLIDYESQLRTLQQMIAEGSEIEPGVPAASASYRLRNHLEMGGDWFCLGTKEHPFCGSFDGDRHLVTGTFPSMNNTPEVMFHANASAKIENLYVNNQMSQASDTELHLALTENQECTEVENLLSDFSGHLVGLSVGAWDLDIQQTAEALRAWWDQNDTKDRNCISITFRPAPEEKPLDADMYIQKVHTALTTLAGAEYREIIEDTLTQETGYLHFVRLEQIGEMTCCTFEIGKDDYYYPGDNYYLILDGTWEGKEISKQRLRIPYTLMERCSVGVYQDYKVEAVDLNFDGKSDLLIHEGYSSGSGGAWDNYRATVWNEETGQFVYFSSFPEQLNFLEFYRQRVICNVRMGAGNEYIYIYEIVNGEYECTKELANTTAWDTGDIYLSYYEMNQLIESHVLSDYDERETLYPDMKNYWP